MQWYIFDRKHLAPATLSMEGGRLPWPVRAALSQKNMRKTKKPRSAKVKLSPAAFMAF
jgi:hypothetical protein